jgi:ribonuclease HI
MTFQVNLLAAAEESIFCQDSPSGVADKEDESEKIARHEEVTNFSSQVWTLYFDGSKSQEGLGAGCILIDPKGKQNFLSYRLEFECTNNTAEYEALVQGLKKAIDLNIKELKVFGDSEIIVRQVKNTIHCNSPHLRNYQQEVHRIIDNFEAFNITIVPRTKNTLVDSLATAASRLSPLEDYEASRFAVELLYRPSVPNNISNWKVFEGDEQIVDFLTNQENFKDLAIDDEIFQELLTESNLHEQKRGTDHPNDKPKFHTIPKGVANLENLFDLRERFKGPKNAKTGSSCPIYETINLGTPENPKNVNLGKAVSKEDRKAYLKLFKEYQDVFAWSYQELKTYDTRIIQHTIPLKYGIKPFQQKLRKYHPSLEPLMYQELKKLLDAKIIFQVRHSAWVANLVPVRKKSGEIRLCVDFRNLNRASEKDNYPVPPMEQLLQTISSSEIFSLLDVFRDITRSWFQKMID